MYIYIHCVVQYFGMTIDLMRKKMLGEGAFTLLILYSVHINTGASIVHYVYTIHDNIIHKNLHTMYDMHAG